MDREDNESDNRLRYHRKCQTAKNRARSQIDEIVRQEVAYKDTHSRQYIEHSEVDPQPNLEFTII